MFSSSCRLGIRALAYLAAHDGGAGPDVSIRRISDDLGIPFHFLTKTLQTLPRAGIVRSQRGPAGGVALARPASAISGLKIIESIDGAEVLSGCVLGLPKCDEKSPCVLHDRWSRERERLRGMFASTSLARLAGDGRKPG